MRALLVLLISNVSFALSGTYTVPVQNPAATNLIDDIQITREMGQIKLKYKLPEDLVGVTYQPLELTLKRKRMSPRGIELRFEDKGAVATCAGLQSGLRCNIAYESAGVELFAQTKFLKEKYSREPRILSNKMRVALSFSNDPIGILEIHCPQYSCGL